MSSQLFSGVRIHDPDKFCLSGWPPFWTKDLEYYYFCIPLVSAQGIMANDGIDGRDLAAAQTADNTEFHRSSCIFGPKSSQMTF